MTIDWIKSGLGYHRQAAVTDLAFTARAGRRLFGLLVLLGTLGYFGMTCIAQESSASPPEIDSLEEDVLDWIDQLDAPTLRQRKAAEEALIDAGPQVLEFLPDPNQEISVEAASRLKRIRKRLVAKRTSYEASEQEVQVRLNDISNLEEALEAISRDSGIEFEHQADSSIPIDSVKAPLAFWHALDLVLDQANLDINFYDGQAGTLALVPRSSDRPSRVDSAAYMGVYRLEPTMVASRRSLKSPDMSGLNISIEISWEPRLTPIGLTLPIQQLAGQLDDGKNLVPQGTSHTIEIATNSELAFSEFFLPMQLPTGHPRQIKSLAGTVVALLPGKLQTFKLPLDQLQNPIKIDSMTVTIEEVRENGPLHELRVGIQLDDADRSLESHRHWIFENDVHVVLKDGSRADHLGYEVYRQSKSGVGIGYLFDLGNTANEGTLLYRSPTAVMKNEVTFVIQDIKLP